MKTQIVLTLANDITLGEYINILKKVEDISPEYITNAEMKVYD